MEAAPHFSPADADTSTHLDLSPSRRLGGVLVPVFALRTEDDLGIGDTAGLKTFIDWAADAGFRMVQILPINETGGDHSPYNAISSLALEPTTLRLSPEALPDLSAADYQAELAGVDLAALRRGSVNYAIVKPLKRRLLERAFASFEHHHLGYGTERDAAFAEFTEKNAAWLGDYAMFRTLMERHGNTECWDRWPEGQRSSAEVRAWLDTQSEEERAVLPPRMEFHGYVQWIAYTQWEEVKRHATARGVALMGDIPFGVSYYSADVWSRPGDFRLHWSGGAPPEPYFKDDAFTQKWGQNWGIPLYDWDAMRKSDFTWWRARVGGVRDVFHVFRIDHILGFYRIYGFPWRPERNAEFLPLTPAQAQEKTGGRLPGFQPRADDTYEHAEANRREGEEYLKMVLAAAGDTALIGEDLGTVPDYVRPSLTALGIAGFKIPIWEPDPATNYQRLIRPEHYAPLSVATFGTHDHEPLVVYWRQHARVLSGEIAGDRGEAQRELDKLADWADLPRETRTFEFSPDVHAHLLHALFRTRSWLAVVMITDLLGTPDRFNVPGTAATSNWSRRLARTVAELRADPPVVALTERVRAMLKETGR
ncbi:MAG: 4-alpha-glucanotransferase [Verrucomicrobia bacterium]|nr:4-alpha-glucanotransferase [Verrucomicrobiota bacterium]